MIPYLNSNKPGIPDYENVVINELGISGDRKVFEMQYDAYVCMVSRTTSTSVAPFYRIAIGSRFYCDGYGVTGQYKYISSPVFFVKKGTKVYVTGNSGSGSTNTFYVIPCL